MLMLMLLETLGVHADAADEQLLLMLMQMPLLSTRCSYRRVPLCPRRVTPRGERRGAMRRDGLCLARQAPAHDKEASWQLGGGGKEEREGGEY